MNKLFVFFIITLFSFANVMAEEIEDNSIIEELEKEEIKVLDYDFKLKSFESCE
jgi:hypothetical protein